MDDVSIVDYGGNSENLNKLLDRFPHARVYYFFNIKNTIKKIINNSVTEKQWIISTCCDYEDFDFSFEPPWHQHYQFHVWPSGTQKRGDTMLFYRKHAIERYSTFFRNGEFNIDYYQDVNWHAEPVPRIPWKIVQSNDIISSINQKYNHYISSSPSPYIWFSSDGAIPKIDDLCLWDSFDRPIHVYGKNKGHVLLPKSVRKGMFGRYNIFTKKYTDHSIVFSNQEKELIKPCDVIYISNGESNAENSWRDLRKICSRAKRVDGITGRKAAYHAAANLSETDYFYAVFPKVSVSYDFSFQPDRLEEPQHYVFDNYNPLNGLSYGHMGIILYHRETLLHTNNVLDYTMSAKNQSIPACISSSRPDNNWWSIWRTAFRECVKLAKSKSIESSYRLYQWKYNSVQGNLAEISRLGAIEGEKYSLESTTDLTETSEWRWLEDYFNHHYKDKNKVLELI